LIRNKIVKNIKKTIRKCMESIYLGKQKWYNKYRKNERGGNKLAKLALILGMILTALTIIEKVLVIHEKVKKLKTKRKRPARRKRK